MRGLLTGLALFAALALFAVSVNFGVPGQELLGTLRFHIGFAALVLPVLLAVFGARLRATVMLVITLASLGHSVAIVLGQQERRAAFEGREAVASLDVLSFNVLGENARGQDAARYIAESGADVVVLMEARGVQPFMGELDAVYPYRVGCETAACDLAILSKFPIADSHRFTFDVIARQRLTQVSLTLADGRMLTVVGAHVTKPYFDDIAEADLMEVASLLEGIEGPLVLAGDFNAAAWSYRMAFFVAETGLVPPPHYPGTWPVELGPLAAPIDNIFTRGDAMVDYILATPEAYGSNHLGLMAKINLY
ncbi:MAG: endonuclease/exonuclease/phosphatase family protein [Candidatus Devosia phytovorans]|uniref:Endonuclease/exonuclease/phosphatase family protein n=1 Tax=Candidatus Devosia phytovorans TaxID=3121372 RepID=A0AAJ6B1M3_9HYPH|nr:endonuclease/exonuclease/phosphatase family protein [Devosia sp.]WEK05499.1 MAG: endonuclease/exonuclease/phosphatase family protein [Devosia sp.]